MLAVKAHIFSIIGFVGGILVGNTMTHYYNMTMGMIFGVAVIGAAIGYLLDWLVARGRSRPNG